MLPPHTYKQNAQHTSGKTGALNVNMTVHTSYMVFQSACDSRSAAPAFGAYSKMRSKKNARASSSGTSARYSEEIYCLCMPALSVRALSAQRGAMACTRMACNRARPPLTFSRAKPAGERAIRGCQNHVRTVLLLAHTRKERQQGRKLRIGLPMPEPIRFVLSRPHAEAPMNRLNGCLPAST